MPLAVLLIVTSCGCTSYFFKPGKDYVESSVVRAHNPEEISFKSADGLTLYGWFFHARGKEQGTILVCHGNAENMSTHVKLDLWLIDAGYNVFIFDYRGYGKSEGTPTVQGINLDAEAALELMLTKLTRPNQDRIIVFGKSLGGAVAVYTVAHSQYRDHVKGLILDSAFSSFRLIAREKIADSVIGWPFQYPLSMLINDDYSPVDFIDSISPIPLLILHGYRDEIVPLHHGQFLYNAAIQPKEFWELKIPGHVKSWTDETTRNRLLRYLSSLPVE